MTSKEIIFAPNSKESEMMVLGCMLTSINSLNIAANALEEDDFYCTEHKIVFQSLKEAFRNDKPSDVHLISEDLKDKNQLQAVGGQAYLMTLAQYAGTSEYIDEYIQRIKEKSIRRHVIQAAQELQKSALDETQEIQICLSEGQADLFKIGQNTANQNGISLNELISGLTSKTQVPFLEELELRKKRYSLLSDKDEGITGISSYFVDLDKMINGLNDSHLLILAARPSMGKTALALNITENICFKNKLPVGIFSLEMTSEEIFHRLICSQAEVESDKIRKGSLNNSELDRVAQAINLMENHVMIIDDQPSLKITELRARAHRMKQAHDIRFLMIDYLQLLSGSRGWGSDNKVQEVSEISRMLKMLARELDIPILCLSQLSRKVEERSDHKPKMSDLRESGSIEQDADIVMLLYRTEYYFPNEKKGQANLSVVKNRHGAVGEISLAFQKEVPIFRSHLGHDNYFSEPPAIERRKQNYTTHSSSLDPITSIFSKVDQ